MTDWKPAVQPRQIYGATVQTIRASITNETGHDVALNGRILRVLPDGRTKSRNRSCSITEALAAADRYGASSEGRLWLIAGALVVSGASNLWLDGERLTPEPGAPSGQWLVDLAGDGSVNARFVGGGE